MIKEARRVEQFVQRGPRKPLSAHGMGIIACRAGSLAKTVVLHHAAEESALDSRVAGVEDTVTSKVAPNAYYDYDHSSV